MAKHLLFWHEPDARFERTYSWIHKHCGVYGYVPVVIDPTGTWSTERPDLPQLVYHSLRDVLQDARFHGHTFVWLDHTATVFLDEFTHPADDVVYCIGSDRDGFGGVEWEGPRVKLRLTGEFFAAFVVPIVCYERYCYEQGWR
jgi:hypothetical protein